MSDDGLFADPTQPAAGVFTTTPTATAPRFDANAPLAARMRPRTLDEVIGQQHLLGPGAPLRRLVHGGAPSSMLLYGPPGTGKTTLATLVAGATGRRFAQLSAIAAGVKEVRGVIEQARYTLRSTGEQTVLFIDEVHRFNKAQQDSLLGAVEDRTVILIGATTENPFFSVVSPLLSRSLILQLQPLTDDDIVGVLTRAVTDDRGLAGRVTLADEARAHLVALSGGDARRSLTALEAAADSVLDEHPRATREEPAAVDLAAVERAVNRAAVRYDKSGDQHYDIISAFIKSMRGSDVDAALHYLARMIEAGEDPRFIARRLMVHASEDVGMADPTALQTAVAAGQVVQMVGMPEAKLALAQATIHIATAPKSGAVTSALGAAMGDVQAGRSGSVPPHLRDGHYPGAAKLGNAQTYVFPHALPDAIATQQYPPDELVGRDYYEPTGRGAERALAERVPRLRRAVRGQPGNTTTEGCNA
ncbi:replication-associated recombination protein A [Nakamurella deserti]|uniref:replication-associated recombination protein A n=1 Tax=Nakamurella deserti TaxID=2164074 RepID=UPI000DBE9C23|nr:replication-associated recombination protein A [Nakamurella deserti]